MLNPAAQVNDRPQSTIEFLPPEFTAAARTPRSEPALAGDESGIGALLRFKSLMNAQGLPCRLDRLCDDRLYAYERIAAAQATRNEGLRRLALELFQIFHRRAIAALAVAQTPHA